MIHQEIQMSNEEFLKDREEIDHMIGRFSRIIDMVPGIFSRMNDFEVLSNGTVKFMVSPYYIFDVLPHVDKQRADRFLEIMDVLSLDGKWLKYDIWDGIEPCLRECARYINKDLILKHKDLACVQILNKWGGNKTYIFRSPKECMCKSCEEMKEIL